MEIRLLSSARSFIATKACFSDEAAWHSASLIITGKKDAVLIDAQWTLSNAHRIVAEILETGKVLKTVFVTSTDPDNYFGLGTIVDAFPEARIVAMPSHSNSIKKRGFFGMIGTWEFLIGPINCPRKRVQIESLDQNYIDLEEEHIQVIPVAIGEEALTSMVWIPSTKTLYASNLLYNQTHFCTGFTTEERLKWIKEIDNIEKIGAEIIIPGHQKPGMLFDKSSLDFTREYLHATDEELAGAGSVSEFYYAMSRRFPRANLISFNQNNASWHKRGWNWREEQ